MLRNTIMCHLSCGIFEAVPDTVYMARLCQGRALTKLLANFTEPVTTQVILTGSGRCIPVSYTHLDVYKRQIVYRAALTYTDTFPAKTNG